MVEAGVAGDRVGEAALPAVAALLAQVAGEIHQADDVGQVERTDRQRGEAAVRLAEGRPPAGASIVGAGGVVRRTAATSGLTRPLLSTFAAAADVGPPDSETPWRIGTTTVDSRVAPGSRAATTSDSAPGSAGLPDSLP